MRKLLISLLFTLLVTQMCGVAQESIDVNILSNFNSNLNHGSQNPKDSKNPPNKSKNSQVDSPHAINYAIKNQNPQNQPKTQTQKPQTSKPTNKTQNQQAKKKPDSKTATKTAPQKYTAQKLASHQKPDSNLPTLKQTERLKSESTAKKSQQNSKDQPKLQNPKIDSPPKYALDNANIPQLSGLSKEQYLAKFYSVWNLDKVNKNKADVFYILPMLQNAIDSNKELENLRANPPSKNAQNTKNAKNHQKAIQEYNRHIAELEGKITKLLGVGENLMPYTLGEFANIIENMNVDSFLKNPKTGIITQAGFIRVVPTFKPRYKSKNDFPFDRWQGSLVFEGVPVMITHFSRDGRYAHVQTPFIMGWIDTRNVAIVSDSLRRKILAFEDYKIPTADFVPLYYENQWVLDARIGQILPFNRRKNKLITFYKDVDNLAQMRDIEFDSYNFADFPMPFSADKMSGLINTMLGQKYGWGGVFANRDCSSFTRDSFASFGVFLPRNSAAQAKFKGAFMDLSQLSNEEKERYIIENGVPFGSVIWLKGHIMLYIGHTNIGGLSRAIVAHSAWGVTPAINGKRESIRLGGVKITTMHIGGAFDSNANLEHSILSRVQGLTNIYADSSYKVDLSGVRVEF